MDHPSSMQQTPLLISSIIEHAALYHGDREIVSRTIETGAVHRTNYKTILSRSKQLANALISLNVTKGDIIATLAWNSYRHLELYYTISSIGAILHTLNPRLFIEQLVYIINHAQDKFICIDITFLPLLSDLIPHLKTVKGIIILTDENNFKLKDYSNFPKSLSIHCYETLLKNQSSNFTWPIFPDTTPSSLCYTSGTTGNPKGVLYTHRSTVIHSLMSCVPDVLGFSARDNVLVIVPLFHANAWGIPYSATMSGCKMVFAGRDLDGETVLGLMVNEEITFTGAVPSVWVLLFQYIDNMREKKNKLPQVKKLRRVISGGSAVPAALIDRLKREFGAELIQIWGMTEMSPLGTVAGIMARHEGMSWEEELKVRTKQGRAIYGVEMRIVDEDGKELKRDGKDFGHLQVRGPGVVQRYFRESKDSAGEDGWFNTGDIATIDKDGYMQITDRAKDVIKSGGEWISSIDLENVVMGYEPVQQCAVVSVRHEKWQERPLLVVVLKPGYEKKVGKKDVYQFLEPRVAKWWLPDDIVFVSELPFTGTGKIEKKKLREIYKDYQWPKVPNIPPSTTAKL